MKHSFASASLALLALLAIAPTQAAKAQESVVTTARYLCDDGDIFRAEFYDGYAIVAMPDDDELYTLPAIQTASGAAYSDGTLALYTEGDEAFMEVGEEVVYDDCEAYRVGSAQYSESETVTIIERRTVPDYDRPVIDFDRPASVTATTEAEPAMVEPAPEPIPGLW
ncbi:MAG: MliC family protein [Cyanobacteria bacterium J06638_20]